MSLKISGAIQSRRSQQGKVQCKPFIPRRDDKVSPPALDSAGTSPRSWSSPSLGSLDEGKSCNSAYRVCNHLRFLRRREAGSTQNSGVN